MQTQTQAVARPARRWKLAAWVVVATAVLIWATAQPATRLEPEPWTGVLMV